MQTAGNGEEGACVFSLKVMFTGILVASEGTVPGNPVLVCFRTCALEEYDSKSSLSLLPSSVTLSLDQSLGLRGTPPTNVVTDVSLVTSQVTIRTLTTKLCGKTGTSKIPPKLIKAERTDLIR